MNAEKSTYFESFGVELVPKEIKIFIGNKNIKANDYKRHSIISGNLCIRFVDFKLKDKSLLAHTNFFLLTNIKYFQQFKRF